MMFGIAPSMTTLVLPSGVGCDEYLGHFFDQGLGLSRSRRFTRKLQLRLELSLFGSNRFSQHLDNHAYQ